MLNLGDFLRSCCSMETVQISHWNSIVDAGELVFFGRVDSIFLEMASCSGCRRMWTNYFNRKIDFFNTVVDDNGDVVIEIEISG